MPGRGARVMLWWHSVTKCKEPIEVGSMGVLHPDVVKSFELTMPVSALLLDVQVFV